MKGPGKDSTLANALPNLFRQTVERNLAIESSGYYDGMISESQVLAPRSANCSSLMMEQQVNSIKWVYEIWLRSGSFSLHFPNTVETWFNKGFIKP